MIHLIDWLLQRVNGFPVLNRKLATLARRYLAIFENQNYNSAENGEQWLVERLVQEDLLTTCFDVGANHGNWTHHLLSAQPDARVFCFEISPETSASLSARFNPDPRVSCHGFGLSDTNGTIEIQHCNASDGLTSMVEVVCSKDVTAVAARVSRGIDFCKEHQIDKIDFLKIDVEGAENRVLFGFANLITPSTIPIIQFEYGLVNIASRFLLKDYYEFFEARGYRVGKLFPDRVRFKSYQYSDEDFRGPNYVACAPEISEILEGAK